MTYPMYFDWDYEIDLDEDDTDFRYSLAGRRPEMEGKP